MSSDCTLRGVFLKKKKQSYRCLSDETACKIVLCEWGKKAIVFHLQFECVISLWSLDGEEEHFVSIIVSAT